MPGCCYLGEPVGVDKCGQSAHECNFLQCHVVEGEGSRVVPGCSSCKHRLLLTDEKFLSKWQDPLDVIDRTRKRTSAKRDQLAGASVFLACSGPSSNDLPLEELNGRGIWTMAVNNMAGHARFRPQAFVCSDPPSKFSHSIWLDPGIEKWVPTPKMSGSRSKLKKKVGDGKFEPLDRTVLDCPNVWGFRRNPWLTPDDQFFLDKGAGWGNQNKGVEKTKQPKTVCTMLLPLRILRYLGARKIFLIGADFRMAADYGYSFEQAIEHKRPKDEKTAPKWDNAQYSVVNGWLCQMQKNGVFGRFGLEIYNCFQHSSLRAFPHVPFSDAIIECRGQVEERPDLAQWYDLAKNS